eukprot:c13698_g1_i1 orf=266-472(+)
MKYKTIFTRTFTLYCCKHAHDTQVFTFEDHNRQSSKSQKQQQFSHSNSNNFLAHITNNLHTNTFHAQS